GRRVARGAREGVRAAARDGDEGLPRRARVAGAPPPEGAPRLVRGGRGRPVRTARQARRRLPPPARQGRAVEGRRRRGEGPAPRPGQAPPHRRAAAAARRRWTSQATWTGGG